MTRRVVALAICGTLCIGSARAGAQTEIRFGLRFDSQSSMQWSRDTLMLHGTSATFMTLPVSTILDVWPGPARGAFAVLSDRGVGMLLGPTLGPSAHPFGAHALLRSSRPAVVVACADSRNGQAHRLFVEWRTGGRQRELLTAPAEVLDFDLDVAGRIIMLTVDQRVLVATGTAVREIPRQAPGGPVPALRLLRVFVDDRGSEIAALTADRLYRFDVETGVWSSIAFDPRQDALVRHVASRRMRVEARFDVSRIGGA